MLDRLARLYTAYMAQDVRSPIPHIAGPPGVGKSQAVEQLAKLVGKNLHVVNVSRMSPLEIEGIQMPINDRLHMLHSTLWTQLKEGDVVLLDEFLRGFPEVYNGLLDILTSRHVAGFDLPKVFFVAASNSVVTYDDALEDRLLHLYVPDLRNSTVEAEKLGKKLTESLGLLPSLATSLEMQDMIQKEIAPMYEVLDQFKGTAQRGAPIKGSSARKLIGQAKLREFQSTTLKELIDLNNQMAMQQAKPQYLLLRPGSKLLKDASLSTKLQALLPNPKLTPVQKANLQINMELINEAAIYAEDRAAHHQPLKGVRHTMLTSQELRDSLTLFEIAPGKKASMQTLAHLLPDVETTLFFAKAYKMSADRLSRLLYHLFRTPLLAAIQEGGHSEDLQDYLVDIVPDIMEMAPGVVGSAPPKTELTDALWEDIDVTIAKSIQDVADNLGDVLNALPGKTGQMVFKTLHTMNKRRPTIGDFKARITHARVPNQLVIFDVSGSMTEHTVRSIAPEVVALSYKANASLAIVSDTTRVWDPGTFSVDDVLREAEYMGTHYETLLPLLRRDWGTVITIADYDSSQSAKNHLRDNAFGTIGQVLDLSLVNRPTYLAECVGQFAKKVTPLLVGSSDYVLS